MTATIIRFPDRRSAAVWLTLAADGWLVMVGAHGWLHGSRREAIRDAQWLAENFGLPIRGIAS